MMKPLIFIFMKGLNQFNITGAVRGSSREKTRLWNLTAMTMVQETLFSIQNNEKSISQVSLWINTNC